MQDVIPNEVVNRTGANQQGRLPEIVPIVLRQAARFRQEGEMSRGDFEEKLGRLTAEELTPRGLELLVRELPDGRTRFLIKKSLNGQICEMIDCAGQQARPAERPPSSGALPRLGMAWDG